MKEEVLAAIADSKNAKLEAKAEENVNKPLIEKAPKAGKIKKISKNEAYNTTEWLLSNGVKVILKPTKFKQDEILLTAFSEGGSSKVTNNADVYSALVAAGVVANNGLANYNSIELGKLLTGKIANVNPNIATYEEGFTGNSSVKDFETMMQLVYLYFTAPRKDDNAFGAMMNMYKASLANAATDPRKAFSDSVSMMLSNHHPRTVLMNLAALDKINQDKALEIYKQRFAVPADFTFVLVGSIDPENADVQKAITTYLGGLISKKGGEKFTDLQIRKPQGKVNNTFAREMKVNKASNFILYSAKMPYTVQNRTLMTAIGSVLNMRYLESIREKEGGSYGVGVRGGINNTPISEATLMMQFDTDPEKQARLMGIIHAEVAEIVKNGPRADDLQKVKENLLKKYTEDVENNQWWQASVVRFYQDKIDLLKDYKVSVEALTPELIQNTLKSIVEQGNVLEVVMKPEAK